MDIDNQPLTINIMTAALTPGDAIGNYILLCADILRGWGVKVNLYADYVAPEVAMKASLSAYYRPTGSAILWFHYSIWSDNVAIAQSTSDLLLIDYHGITPPHLLDGNPHLQHLCEQAIAALPMMAKRADAAIVHSTFTENELLATRHPPAIYRIPLAVDLSKFKSLDEPLADLLEHVPYMLFVGRIVPQKDIIAMVDLFAAVQGNHPDLRLIMVGSYDLLPGYKRQIDQHIAKHHLQNQVEFTGQINNPAVLTSLFSHARFYCALSEWESFCVPIAESLYFGTPAVVSNTPPLPEVAGAGGIVVNKNRLGDAAQLITHLLKHDVQYDQLRATAWQVGQTYTSTALDQNLQTMFANLSIHQLRC